MRKKKSRMSTKKKVKWSHTLKYFLHDPSRYQNQATSEANSIWHRVQFKEKQVTYLASASSSAEFWLLASGLQPCNLLLLIRVPGGQEPS